MNILDQKEREIAQDPSRSCIVQAPAGSGKTTLLARRYVGLLSVVTQPEQILAITFTKKAAAEMRDRVLEELADTTSEIGQAASKHAIDQAWQLEKYPSRLRIQTIDAFAMNLVRQLPVNSPLQQRAICAHPEDYYDQAVARVLRRASQPDQSVGDSNDSNIESDRATLAVELLQSFFGDATQIHNLLVTMLRRREQWQFMLMDWLANDQGAELVTAIESGVRDLQEDSLQKLHSAFDETTQQKLADLARYAADNLEGQPAFDELGPFEQWRFIAENLLLKTSSTLSRPELRKTVTKSQGFPAVKPVNPRKDEMLALLEDIAAHPASYALGLSVLAAIRLQPLTTSIALDRDRIALIGAVLFDCVNELTTLFNEGGEVDFNQITIAAIAALGNEDAPTDLALSLDYQISHLLIDEFQDTSRAQHELFIRLIREWAPGDGNTFFAVGDPMQSIYRFRNADVSLFLEVCTKGMANLPLEYLRLTTNFRSQDSMISWFNQVFDVLLGDNNDPNLGAISYTAATSPRTQLGTLEHTKLLAPMQLSSTLPEQYEQIVEHIKTLTETADYPDIAILLRNRGPAGALVQALEAANIPWQGTDLHALKNMAIVSDAVSLAKTLYDPTDRVSAFALLRGPLVGLTFNDLAAMAEALRDSADNCADVDNTTARVHSPIFDVEVKVLEARLSASGIETVQRLQTVAKPLLGRRLTLTPRELVESLWLQLGGPLAYPATTHKHLSRFLDVLETSHPRRFDPERLERDIDNLYAEDDTSGVQILTVHKSKGLQYQHVLIPNLQAKPRADDGQLLMSRESRRGYLMAARLPGKTDNDKKQRTLYHWLKLEEQQRAKNETKRLMYVAATRAEVSVRLFGTISDNKTPPANSLLDALTAVFGVLWQGQSDGGNEIAVSPAPQDTVDLAIQALPASLAAPTLMPPDFRMPQRSSRVSRRLQTSEIDDPELLFSAERRAAILRGNLTHQALCSLSRGEDAVDALIANHASFWHQQAIAAGLSERLADEVEALTADGLLRVANSPVGRWCAVQRHEDSQAELPLTLWEQSGPIKLAIDRTFVVGEPPAVSNPEQRTRWIIDYKTARPPGDAQSREPWLAQQNNRYRKQLAGYARAMAALHPHQCLRTALYFTALDELWEIATAQTSGKAGGEQADRRVDLSELNLD